MPLRAAPPQSGRRLSRPAPSANHRPEARRAVGGVGALDHLLKQSTNIDGAGVKVADFAAVGKDRGGGAQLRTKTALPVRALFILFDHPLIIIHKRT